MANLLPAGGVLELINDGKAALVALSFCVSGFVWAMRPSSRSEKEYRFWFVVRCVLFLFAIWALVWGSQASSWNERGFRWVAAGLVMALGWWLGPGASQEQPTEPIKNKDS